jgi:hypothetical protein
VVIVTPLSAFPNYGLPQVPDLSHASNRLENDMATKEQVIPVVPPPHTQLTNDEADVLRERFRADLANVVPAKVATNSIVGVTNINHDQTVTRKGQSKKKRKTTKKGAAKKTTKKKGARKTTKKTSRKR